MDQVIFPFILTDPAGRKHECEYVFDMDGSEQPTSCALWVDDHCINGEVWDYMSIWKCYQASQQESAMEAAALRRMAA